MKKLLFIAMAAILALSIGLVGCTAPTEEEEEEEEPAVWNTTIPLQMHCTISNRASIVEFIFDPWVAQLEAITGDQGGKFDVTVTYGDAPFDATTSLAAITNGVVDIGQLSGDTFHLGGIGILPWLFPDMETAAYVTHLIWTEGNQKWDNGELSGVKILISAPLWGAEWWGNVEVKVPADLEGVKVRAEGAEAAGLLALGASPVYLGTSEIGPALQTHIVDGCFFTWSGIGGFSGVGPNVQYVTQLDIFYRVYALAMNKASYDALPAEAQEAIDSLSTPAKSVELAAAHSAGAAEDKAATEAAKPVYVPTAEELAAWKTATAGVKADWAAYMTDPLGFDGAGILARVATLISQAP